MPAPTDPNVRAGVNDWTPLAHAIHKNLSISEVPPTAALRTSQPSPAFSGDPRPPSAASRRFRCLAMVRLSPGR